MEKKPPLRHYQKKSLDRVLKNEIHALFLDPGLGKTRVMVEAFKILKKRNVVDTMLVVCQGHVAYNTWPNEVKKWSTTEKEDNVFILHGAKKNKQIFDVRKGDVAVVTFDLLHWFKKMYFDYEKTLKFGRIMMVVDESTKLKHGKSRRSKSIWALRTSMARRYILTGTPTANSLLDLHNQIKILDGNRRLGTKTRYRNNFFIPFGYMGYESRPMDDAEEQIFRVIKDICVRFDESELKLPPKEVIDIPVQLGQESRKIYHELQNEFITILEDDPNPLVCKSGQATYNKLRQIPGGSVYMDLPNGERVTKHLGRDKLDALVELVDELQGKPCLISYEFQHEFERIMEEFPKAETLTGAGKNKSQDIIKRWNMGMIPQLVVHPQSAAHGLNLQEIKAAVVFYSITYNLELYIQLIRRIWRQGQKHKVFVYRLIAVNTMDGIAKKALETKQTSQSKFLNLLKKEIYTMTDDTKTKGDFVSKVKKDIAAKSIAPTKKKATAKKAAPKKAAPKKAVAKKAAPKKAATTKKKAVSPKKATTSSKKAATTTSSPKKATAKDDLQGRKITLVAGTKFSETRTGAATVALRLASKKAVLFQTLVAQLVKESGKDEKYCIGAIKHNLKVGKLKAS